MLSRRSIVKLASLSCFSFLGLIPKKEVVAEVKVEKPIWRLCQGGSYDNFYYRGNRDDVLKEIVAEYCRTPGYRQMHGYYIFVWQDKSKSRFEYIYFNSSGEQTSFEQHNVSRNRVHRLSWFLGALTPEQERIIKDC